MNIKIHYLTFYIILSLLSSCSNKKDLGNLLNIKKDVEFNHSKTIRDVKNNFEVNIGDTWKRELYFDDYQSRIYAADTTRSYSSSFIVDITRFKGKIIIEDAFKNKLTEEIKRKSRNYIISDGFLNYKEMPAYYVFSFEKKYHKEIYSLNYYIAGNDHYYLMSSTINTSNNLAISLSESVNIFNSLNILP